MTFQPPPPPPPPPAGPPTPPPPPPGSWGPPPGQGPTGGGGSFDPKSVNQLDWAILGAGVLAFIFSFVSYYTFSPTHCGSLCDGISVDENAWHGFFGWFAMLAALAGSAAVGLALFQPNVKLPMANRAIAVIAYAVASLCVILALFLVPGYLGYDGSGIDKGHGFGYWISLIVILAGLVLSLMRAQQTGTSLPGPLNNVPKIGK